MEEPFKEHDDQEQDNEIQPENDNTKTQSNDATNVERRNQTETRQSSERRNKPTSSMEEEENEKRLNNGITHKQNITATTSKRPHQMDSDLDLALLPRRPRIKPTPNLNAARKSKNNKDSTPKL